jgi:hypothetical protein
MSLFPIRRASGLTVTSRRRTRRPALAVDRLEDRRMLAILPGQVVTTANYIDADGDSVAVTVTGTVQQGAGFVVELAGQATDNADATLINLSGLTSDNGLRVVVTPNAIASQPGTGFATLYSPGYTNVAFLSNDTKYTPGTPMVGLGGIQLSAAVVNSMSLDGIAVGNITLDVGQAPFCDRINTQNNQQAADSKMYQPVTGLIDLGGITAASINSLVINGAISAPTGNPFDLSVTNDFRSVINVSGSIGSVIGLRSNMSAAIRAQSLGSVRVASIAGEITTRGSDPFSINLPTDFKGFINAGGHLNLGFPLSDGAKITGQINAAGGISGSDKSSTTDTLFLPGGYAGSFTNTSTTTGIADIEIDGVGLLTISSASSVGNISADEFGGDFVVEAGTSIGNIEAGQGGMEGNLSAGTDIGSIRAVRNIEAMMIAGGDIGSITSVVGNVEARSIQAGGDIGVIRAYTGILGTSIVAGGDLAGITIPVGDIELSAVRARDIGPIEITDGSIQTSSFVATRDIGTVSTFGSEGGFGIQDVSMVAGRDIGAILAQTHAGYGIRLLKLDAGRRIASVSGISYGQFGSLDNAAILESNFLASSMGAILGRSSGGRGIEASKFITRTAYDGSGNIDRSTGRIDSVVGDGWLDGLFEVIVVAHTDIGAITGNAYFEGSGISGGSYDANYGEIGQITAAGGAGSASGGGFGIDTTRFQATDLTVGRIAGITTSANANGRDAMSEAKVYAGSIGPIRATVHGGLDGNGIVGGEIRAFGGANGGAIDSVSVNVRSINGIGIQDGKITASGDFGPLTVNTFNATGISGGEFQSRGNFGDISVVAEKGGNGIENAIFTAPGRIFYDAPYNDPPPPALDVDPKGSFGRITVDANGTNALSNGIVGTKFSAIGDIGLITVRTKGATAIVDSTFAADTDGDYTGVPSAANPGQNTGTIAGIAVVAAGRNLALSSGIVNSKFTAAMIGPVTAAIQTVEGGDGIVDSRFEARTAIYDDFGNYDNVGRIGNVTVTNAADQLQSGAGIRGSKFFAGAGGGIGNLAVTTASGSGIIASAFDASIQGVVFDPDQNLFTSTIGTITVNSGRVAGYTLVPAGVTLSTFTAAAGIGAVTVNSVGSGITGSIFEADFDWQLTNDAQGSIGNITVRVPGRNASAVTGSVFGGFSLGTIDIRLANNAQNGVNAVALSNFNARGGAIGNVTVVHSMTGVPYSTGLGYAILTSSFVATTGIGTISITGNTRGAVFIVGGQPVQPVAARVSRVGVNTVTNGIGGVTLAGGQTHGLTFTASALAGLSYANAPANAAVQLVLNAAAVGNIDVAAPIGSASLDISGLVGALGNVTVDGTLSLVCPSATAVGAVATGGALSLVCPSATSVGTVTTVGNASLSAPALQTLGGLSIGGTLSLPQGLPSLRQCGDVTAAALATIPRGVQIGSGTVGSSMGRLRIAAANRGKGVYGFAFASWPANATKQNPVAIVGGRSIVSATARSQAANGVSIVRMARP